MPPYEDRCVPAASSMSNVLRVAIVDPNDAARELSFNLVSLCAVRTHTYGLSQMRFPGPLQDGHGVFDRFARIGSTHAS